jgi:DNA-binding CsgD family transcriptional regulator/tetratricopeptide (TPR) repeat protein
MPAVTCGLADPAGLGHVYLPCVADAGVPSLTGRARECAALDEMLDRVRDGEGAVLVLRGEAGIGKSALMSYCAGRASGCRLAHVAGVESELEMPFAGLHQLCRPMLADVDTLPEPQQQALQVAFGLAAGSAPDRFVVGLAVLGLLAEVGAKRPLVCLIDDAQWLDEPSCQVIGFVGRRLLAEAVLLLLAVRETGDARLFGALPSLTLTGLAQDAARALLAASVSGHLDERVRDRIVAETRGNPLRLLEVPREISSGELAGGFGLPQMSASGPIEEHYKRRIWALPEPTQRLMLLASADPTGDATLLWRAARTVGIPHGAAAVAESEELLEIGSDVRFRHPLVRSAAYASATAEDRRAAHAVLADAIDAVDDRERRVWHLASAAAGANEAVALELEATAAAAQARAGLAAAATFLQRSVELTADPELLAQRALAAAQAHLHAGAFDAALGLLAKARAAATDDVQRARVERLNASVRYASNAGPEAPLVLLKAAKTLESLDVNLARETYLDAWMASYTAGSRAPSGGLLPEVSRAARSAPPAAIGAPLCDLFLDGLATVVTDGRAEAAASLRTAVDAFLGDDVSDAEYLQWGHLASTAANLLWDCHSFDILSAKYVELARVAGALARLSMALNLRGVFAAWCGDFEATTALVAEFNAVNDAAGIGWFSACGLLQAAYHGRPGALTLIDATAADCAQHGVGQGVHYACWMRAIVCNGLGRYEDALAAAERAAYEMDMPNGTGWALPEVIEAAVRSGQPGAAREAMQHLSKHTLDEADWAAGIEARSRALVTDGAGAESWYAEAVRRLAATPFGTELARARLLYGEWLRREGRRVDAREQLAPAYEMFVAMGAEAFAERARRELSATGKTVRKRSLDVSSRDELTPQEAHIARLARDGRSNADIGAELFLSVRTVEWHLRKIFIKLGVSSRKDLKEALPSPARHLAGAA